MPYIYRGKYLGKLGSSNQPYITMSSFIHTVEDIQSATGLTRKLIDRCFRGTPHILGVYRRKLGGNKWWYNHGAIEIFQRVAVMKQNGRNFPEIKRWLESEFGNSESNREKGQEALPSTPESAGEVPTPSDHEPATDQTTLLISTLKDAHQLTLDTKDDILKIKDDMITTLKGSLKLLEEGRETREQRETDLRGQVKALNTKITTEEERRRQRKALYSKADSLKGWGKRKQLKAVLKEIEGLDAL